MTVHFLKGASAHQLEEIQQQNNLGDDAGLKCFGIWILCINFSHHLAIFSCYKKQWETHKNAIHSPDLVMKKYCKCVHFWEQIFLQHS